MLLLKMTCKNAAKNNALVTVKCCSVNDEDAAFSASHQHVIFSLSAARCTCRQEGQEQEASQGYWWHPSWYSLTVTSMPFIFL